MKTSITTTVTTTTVVETEPSSLVPSPTTFPAYLKSARDWLRQYQVGALGHEAEERLIELSRGAATFLERWHPHYFAIHGHCVPDISEWYTTSYQYHRLRGFASLDDYLTHATAPTQDKVHAVVDFILHGVVPCREDFDYWHSDFRQFDLLAESLRAREIRFSRVSSVLCLHGPELADYPPAFLPPEILRLAAFRHSPVFISAHGRAREDHSYRYQIRQWRPGYFDTMSTIARLNALEHHHAADDLPFWRSLDGCVLTSAAASSLPLDVVAEVVRARLSQYARDTVPCLTSLAV